MTHDEFIGHVQHRARLASRGQAERATRVVLETLGERLAGGEPFDLAAQLPPEIGRHPNAGVDGSGPFRHVVRALRQRPRQPGVVERVGGTPRGNTAGAVRAFATAIELNPKLPSLQSFYGQALLRTGDADGAAEEEGEGP